MTRCPHVLFVLAIAACGGTSDAALNEPTIDTLPGGIVRVTNTGPTAWRDTTGWTLREEMVIAPAEGSEGELSDVGSVVADTHGNVYVFQSRPALIRAYGPDGAWLRDIGREGDGPGEYRHGMFGIHGDTLFVQDPNNTRLTTFLTSGEFIASYPSQCCYWTSNFPTFDDGTIGIPGPPPPSASERRGAMYLTRIDGKVVDTILFPARNDDPNSGWSVTKSSGKSRSMMSMGIPLKPADVAAYLPNRRHVRGHNSTYQFAITGLRDDTLRVFRAVAPTLSITEAERDSIFDEVIAGVDEEWREAVRGVAKKSDIPTTWPVWSQIMIDGRSRIWIARPGARGEVSILDVFTPDGVLLGSVSPPEGFEMRGTWVGDRLYQRAESADGLPQVRVYRVDAKVRTDAEKER